MASGIERHVLVDDSHERVVRVTRTSERFESALELEHVWTALNRKLDPLRNRGYALLVDTRQAPARNDADFEHTFAPLRARMFVGFTRRAVLVRSPAGRLQVQRHARQDGIALRAFAEERDAIAYLVAG